MRRCKMIMSWYFCVLSVILLAATIWTASAVIHSTSPVKWPRFVLVDLSFLVTSTAFAAAWWTVWRSKKSGRVWAIVASLLSILQSVYGLFLGWDVFVKWFVGTAWLPTAFGVVGLIAFLWPDKQQGSRANPEVHHAPHRL